MLLTPDQIRTACREHLVAAGTAGWGASDELLAAMCRRLALVPDVRWPLVQQARSRLLVAGPPSSDDLAAMLVDQLCSSGAR